LTKFDEKLRRARKRKDEVLDVDQEADENADGEEVEIQIPHAE
jgi:hypothetical protein